LGAFPGWHGSRHLFQEEPGAPYGQFRHSAIGSGEGAQAYGWGHYIAGGKGTGEYYKRAGEPGPEEAYVTLNGRKLVYDPDNSGVNCGKDHFIEEKGNVEKAKTSMRQWASGIRRSSPKNADEMLNGIDWLEANHHRMEYHPPADPDPGYLY